jgi:fatty-acyl-CoA synthase
MAKYDDERLLTLADLLEDRAYRSGSVTYAIFPDATITYKGLRDEAAALAKGLIAMGLKPGQHVAIMMPNCLHFMIAHYAVQLAAGVSILLNARFKRHELSHLIEHCDARMVLTTYVGREHVDFAGLVRDSLPGLERQGQEVRAPTAPLLRRLVAFGSDAPAAFSPVAEVVRQGQDLPDRLLWDARTGQGPEDTSVMIYTSGTTAMPKACELSGASLQRSWRIFARAVGLEEGQKLWDPMPFFHSGGIGLMTGLMARGATILSTPHFDPDEVAELVERHQVEHLYPGFHTLALPLVRSKHYDRERWSRFVRTTVVVGPLGTLHVIRDLLPAGVPIMNLYGLSEGSGLVTLTPPEASETVRLTAAGRPMHGADVRIVDPETLADLPAGQRGEILFRGVGAFRGYYRDPDATRKAILPGGWVRTGDLGMFDADGWLHFLGRIKDMLKVGGENVAAAEVESFLSSHPAVKFVQVVGKPDDRMGEVVVAFVELNPGMQASEDDIVAFCKGRIASFKIPTRVIFVTDWPMSATKVQKFRLKEQLLAGET